MEGFRRRSRGGFGNGAAVYQALSAFHDDVISFFEAIEHRILIADHLLRRANGVGARPGIPAVFDDEYENLAVDPRDGEHGNSRDLHARPRSREPGANWAVRREFEAFLKVAFAKTDCVV